MAPTQRFNLKHLVHGMVLVGCLCLPMTGMAEEKRKGISALTQSLCGTISGAGNQIASQSDEILSIFLKRIGIKAPSKADKIKFLNRNKDNMICENTNQHYMKYALDMGKHRDVFRKFFMGKLGRTKDLMHVDVNAVTLGSDKNSPHYNKPETLLDYLDFIVATHKFGKAYSDELKSLRRGLVKHWKAKTFSEFTDDEKAHHQRRLKQ